MWMGCLSIFAVDKTKSYLKPQNFPTTNFCMYIAITNSGSHLSNLFSVLQVWKTRTKKG